MSDQNTETGIPTDWRARIKAEGKQAFELDEMRRLGFWPPPEGLKEKVAEAEQEVKRLNREIAPMRSEVAKIEAEIAKAGDVQTALDEIRRKRIERVKAEREQRKVRQAIERADKAVRDKQARLEKPLFLGYGVSAGLSYGGTDEAKLRAANLPVLLDAAQIAAAMEIGVGELSWLSFHRGAAVLDHYHRFRIPKKKGGMRNVSSPKTRLRHAQNWLLQSVLTPLPIHPAATAFRVGASILENARRHAAKPLVFRLDLKDFFPSVGFARVKNFFQNLGYSQGVATIFALLATEAPRLEMTLDGEKRHVAIGERVLPQGACTSPALTNLLCRNLDARLTGLAAKYGFMYSRYADDLIFSTDNAAGDYQAVLEMARRIVADENFVVNDEKTLVMKKNHRQTVTGLVVNAQSADGPRVSRRDLRKFRAFLHHYDRFGREVMTEKLGRDALAYARGYLSFVQMSEPERAAKFVAAHGWLSRGE